MARGEDLTEQLLLTAHGRTVVHVAAALGAVQCLRYLLQLPGLNLEICDYENGWNALHRATYHGEVRKYCEEVL